MSERINEKIKEYLQELSNFLLIKYVYVYGSYANEKYDPEKSDIDLAIFSKQVTSENRHEYIKKCLRAISKYKLDIQPLVFSVEDYLSSSNDFIKNEVKNKGILHLLV
ncbi:MAG: nucleotidyltransferase domain-containing protein [bacterium]